MQAQNEEYKQRLSTLDKGYMSEYEGSITTQEAQAKRALAEAHEAGDYEKVADAQSAIAQIAIEKERLRLQNNVLNKQAQEVCCSTRTGATAATQPQPQHNSDPKLESWLSKNKWFGKDKYMTGAARALHETLVAEEGFDPQPMNITRKLIGVCVREMPNKFQGDKKNVQSVTPAGKR